MNEILKTLSVVNPRMAVLDLVALALEGNRVAARAALQDSKVDINENRLSDPDEILLVKTDDVLTVADDRHRIKIVAVAELQTERLFLTAVQVADISFLALKVPEWDVLKNLDCADEKNPADVQEAFRSVIDQPPPKTDFLWKVAEKTSPEKIIGLAHMKTDAGRGQQKMWLDKTHQGKGYAEEIAAELSEHGFSTLGFSDMVFKDAFTHAIAPKEIEKLRNKFAGPQSSWNLTRDKWQKEKEKKKQILPQTPSKPPGGK